MTLVKQALMDLKVTQDVMVTLEYKDHKVFLDHQAKEVTQVLLGLQVFR